MIQEIGLETISERLLLLKSNLVSQLESLGYKIHGPKDGINASSITTFNHEKQKASIVFEKLNEAGIVSSCRKNRQGEEFLRFSPHFYNTEREIDQKTKKRVLKNVPRALLKVTTGTAQSHPWYIF